MARETTRFILTGPREGQDFNPRNQPGVEFVKGVAEVEAELDKIPIVAKVLATYGAYPESKMPVTTEEDESDAQTPAEKSKGKAPAKTRKPAKKSTADKSAGNGTATDNDGAGTDGTDGSGDAGTSDAETLI